ncbi:hypothetical protein HGA88_03040 [Candidatus Roizmanbacteria bacterium]|nr:hypothetical protein [Candidatus Roizmanbacteria bacterium]
MKYRINLLPPKERNIVDRVIYFSFHYLRYILVFTQLIVIFVFFYRFKVDQEIIDLKDALDQKQEIVAVSQPLVREVESMTNKITIIEKITKGQDTVSAVFSYIMSYFPASVSLTRLSITANGVVMEGATRDVIALRSYYYRLKSDARFAQINLSNLQKTELGYTFNLSLLNFNADKKT